jgi:protein dithiol oxidoreductase (disulfide-forming)
MRLMRILSALLLTLAAVAAPAQELGRDYTRLTLPQAPETGDKVEVLEFFSWGCSHCAEMHPLLEAWKRQLPAHAALVKVPISLGHNEWGQLVRAYYALEALGELARIEGPIYDAIHKERQPLFTEERIAQWLGSHGVDVQKFRNEFNSFNVTTKASRAEQLSRNYRVNQTPQLIVDGKYIVRGKSHEEGLEIASKLIEKAAAERKSGT